MQITKDTAQGMVDILRDMIMKKIEQEKKQNPTLYSIISNKIQLMSDYDLLIEVLSMLNATATKVVNTRKNKLLEESKLNKNGNKQNNSDTRSVTPNG